MWLVTSTVSLTSLLKDTDSYVRGKSDSSSDTVQHSDVVTTDR